MTSDGSPNMMQADVRSGPPAPLVKGWCPGALRPMLSGDGWVVRVRPPGGRLTVEQASGLARLAAAQGSGMIDLSARANLQIRGVDEGGHPALLEGLAALGLLDDSPQQEARRNIMVTPFADAEADALASGLACQLAETAVALPGKFGFAVDTGPTPVLTAASADIRIERVERGLLLRADGMNSGRLVGAADAAEAAVALAAWFLSAGGAADGRGRMATLVGRGVVPSGHTVAATAGSPPPPEPGIVAQGALIGLAFGQIEAAHFAALAQLGPIRTTPWRLLLIEGLARMPAAGGIITCPGDPLLSVTACTGAPGCPQALGETRSIARALAARISGLHVSGCAKGCAHPGSAPVTLVAAGNRRYDLIRNGRAGDPAHLTKLDPEAPDFLYRVIHAPPV